MKRLFGSTTLLCAVFSAHAGLIRADFRAGTGYEVDGSDFLSSGNRWDSGDAWLGPGPVTDTLTMQAQDRVDFQASGTTVTGITFLAEPPPEHATPIPEPATLALFGLGAGALGLARQGKGKRA